MIDKIIGFLVYGFLAFCVFGIYSCSKEMGTPEYQAKQVQMKKACETPRLVSEIDGVKLYVVNPNCYREVYFSKSGTHTTYMEHHGKSTSIYDDDVSNGDSQ